MLNSRRPFLSFYIQQYGLVMARPTQPKDEYPTRIYHLDKDEFGSRETEVFPPSKIIPQMNYDVVMHELVLRQSMLHHEYEMNMKYQTALHNHSKMAMNYQACDIAPMTYTTNQGYASMQTWDMSQSQVLYVRRVCCLYEVRVIYLFQWSESNFDIL